MDILEFLSELLDLFLSWRLYLCLAAGATIAYFLHTIFSGTIWPWFLSIPAIIASLITGWRWQITHDQKEHQRVYREKNDLFVATRR